MKKYFLSSKFGIDVAKRPFDSEEEAKKFKAKFSHIPAIKDSKVVFGEKDMHGFVTPRISESMPVKSFAQFVEESRKI